MLALFGVSHGVVDEVVVAGFEDPHADALADGGRMVPIGLGAGVQTAGVEINRTVRRSQSILGSYGARTRQDLPAVVDLASEGVINYKEIVSQHFSLEQAGEGYKALRDQKIQGRAIVDMSL